MSRIDEALDILFEDEEIVERSIDFLSSVEGSLRIFLKNFEKLPDEQFFEIIAKIRERILSGDYEDVRKLLEGKMGVITVTYELGALGMEFANKLSKLTGYTVAFSEILEETAKRLGVPEWKVEDFDEFKYVPSKLSLFGMFQLEKSFIDFGAMFGGKKKEEVNFEQFKEALTKAVTAFAVSNKVILVGHGAACILKDYPNCLHVKIEAPFEDRVKTYAERVGVSLSEAQIQLKRIDERERDFYIDVCNTDIKDINLYHLKLNTSKLSVDVAADITFETFKKVVGEEG
jgi:cytidylate kinase